MNGWDCKSAALQSQAANPWGLSGAFAPYYRFSVSDGARGFGWHPPGG